MSPEVVNFEMQAFHSIWTVWNFKFRIALSVLASIFVVVIRESEYFLSDVQGRHKLRLRGILLSGLILEKVHLKEGALRVLLVFKFEFCRGKLEFGIDLQYFLIPDILRIREAWLVQPVQKPIHPKFVESKLLFGVEVSGNELVYFRCKSI